MGGADHDHLTAEEKKRDEFRGMPMSGEQRDDCRICPRCKDNAIANPEKLEKCKELIQRLTTQLETATQETEQAKSLQEALTEAKKDNELLEKEKKLIPKLLKMKLTQEPEFTTSKWRKGGQQVDKQGITNQTIDYIFYTEEIECAQILALPKEKIEACYMPGWKYPSDHFCIAADLVFMPQEQTRRRMAQREHSNRRDSPAMTRLLKEIIDAQDN